MANLLSSVTRHFPLDEPIDNKPYNHFKDKYIKSYNPFLKTKFFHNNKIVDVNGKNKRKLFSIVKSGDLSLLQQADISVDDAELLDDRNCCLLTWAAFFNHADIFDFLFEKFNTYEKFHLQFVGALVCATWENSLSILEYGFSKISYFPFDESQLSNILFKSFIDDDNTLPSQIPIRILKFLLDKGANVNLVGKYGYTLLCKFAENGELAHIQFLYEHGSDVEKKDMRGRSPLLIAAYYGHNDIVEYLCSKNANINLIDDAGHNALSVSILDENINLIKYVCKKSKLINIPIEKLYDSTPLMLSILYKNSLEIIKILCLYGADINAINKVSITAVMIAASKGNNNIVQYLYENGADINCVNQDKKSSHSYAAKKKQNEVLNYLNEIKLCQYIDNNKKYSDSNYVTVEKLFSPQLPSKKELLYAAKTLLLVVKGETNLFELKKISHCFKFGELKDIYKCFISYHPMAKKRNHYSIGKMRNN